MMPYREWFRASAIRMSALLRASLCVVRRMSISRRVGSSSVERLDAACPPDIRTALCYVMSHAGTLGQGGVRRRAVDGLLAFNPKSRARMERVLGVWWRPPAPFGDG